MGYRSDVGICLSFPVRERFYKEVNLLNPNRKKLVNEFLSMGNTYHYGGDVCFVWRNVSWDDISVSEEERMYAFMHFTPEQIEQIKSSNESDSTYVGVHFLTDFIHSLGDSDDYLLIRIGEALEDIYQSGLYFDNPFALCLKRELGSNSF